MGEVLLLQDTIATIVNARLFISFDAKEMNQRKHVRGSRVQRLDANDRPSLGGMYEFMSHKKIGRFSSLFLIYSNMNSQVASQGWAA